MSDNFFGDDVFFESDYDPQYQQTEKSGKNQSDAVEENNINIPISFNTSGQKNKYINRIKSMAPIQSILKARKSLQEEEDGKSLDKKQRNKMSAKNSRDRKKLYIEIMEEKKKTLEYQLECKRRELEESKNYYDRIVSQSKTMTNFASSRHQLIKRLEVILQNKLNGNSEDPTLQINSIIDELRSRIGATGKERINTINQYFRQIVNLSLPALHRYMMWSAAQNKHLFADDEQRQAKREQWFKELKNSLNLTEEQKKNIRNKQQFLSSQKQTLESLIEQLRNLKDEIQNKSIQLDDIIDEIRKILTPIQCAHFIIFIEQNKYRKQLNLCDIANYEGMPRKMVKKERQN